MGTQTEYQYSDKPPIRSIRDCRRCEGVGQMWNFNFMVTVAVQAVCEEPYHHQYYLTKAEAIEKDPDLAQDKEQTSSAP